MAPETMSISVNGQSKVPPGFRFHPTEEELLLYYLRKKVSFENIDLDVIQDVDLNKLEPWDIQEKCKIGFTPQNDWYFFSHKDKKYPTGTRTNRATISGFWKATGRDKVIYSNYRKIGMRKTLVFYRGRAPHGLKSDWIMHEYRLDDDRNSNASLTSLVVTDALGETTLEEAGWVVCRVFRKKNHYKNHLDDVSHITMSTNTISETEIPVMLNPSNEGTLEQMLEYMERNCKERGSGTPFLSSIDNKFMQLPSLESPRNSTTSGQTCYQPFHLLQMINSQVTGDPNSFFSNLGDLDQLVASHLNDQNETPKLQACFSDTNIICCDQNPSPATIHDLQTQRLQSLSSPSSSTNRTYHCHQDYSNEFDLWSFERPL